MKLTLEFALMALLNVTSILMVWPYKYVPFGDDEVMLVNVGAVVSSVTADASTGETLPAWSTAYASYKPLGNELVCTIDCEFVGVFAVRMLVITRLFMTAELFNKKSAVTGDGIVTLCRMYQTVPTSEEVEEMVLPLPYVPPTTVNVGATLSTISVPPAYTAEKFPAKSVAYNL